MWIRTGKGENGSFHLRRKAHENPKVFVGGVPTLSGRRRSISPPLPRMPILSIITPVFNASATIEKTWQSLARLSFETKKQIEWIVVDDGSADNSGAEIEAQKNNLAPMVVKIIRQNNMGSAGARNAGLAMATGEWVFFLDADDELEIDPLPLILGNRQNVALVFAARFWKNNKSAGTIPAQKITRENFWDIFTAGNPFSSSNVIFKKSALQKNFDPDFKYLEDWNFWLDNRHLFDGAHFFPKIDLVKINIHGKNKSANYRASAQYRRKIADKIWAQFGRGLRKKQKNNLILQIAISKILQDQKISPRAFVLFPCNVVLYLKFLAYYFTRGNFQKYRV